MKCRTARCRLTLAILASAVALATSASGAEWPTRTTPRPVTTEGVPHIQLNVEPLPELTAELLRRVEQLPHVDVRDTVVSLPGAKGFWLADDLPLERPDVIVGGREFAHIHPDGSLHASLNPKTAQAAIEAGWAIAHPWSSQRRGWEGFVMIYTPLSEDELEITFRLIQDSYTFVTGRTLANE
ncbi:MAG: luciferase family protein [Pseudomonadota bacterium]